MYQDRPRIPMNPHISSLLSANQVCNPHAWAFNQGVMGRSAYAGGRSLYPGGRIGKRVRVLGTLRTMVRPSTHKGSRFA